MNNNELKTKRIRLVAYRPLELEMLINSENSFGLDKQLLNDILTNVKDYPYAYELCTLWAVYKIDNLVEPLFFIHANGINYNRIVNVNLINNNTRKIGLDDDEINDAIKLMRRSFDEFNVRKVTINKDEEIFKSIKVKKREQCKDFIQFKYIGFVGRLISAIITPIVFGIAMLLFVFAVYIFNDYYLTTIETIGTIFLLFIPSVLIVLFVLAFPVIHLINSITKQEQLKWLLIMLDVRSFILNIIIIGLFLTTF